MVEANLTEEALFHTVMEQYFPNEDKAKYEGYFYFDADSKEYMFKVQAKDSPSKYAFSKSE